MAVTTQYLSTTTVARHKFDAAGILYRIDVFADGEQIAQFPDADSLRTWWVAANERGGK